MPSNKIVIPPINDFYDDEVEIDSQTIKEYEEYMNNRSTEEIETVEIFADSLEDAMDQFYAKYNDVIGVLYLKDYEEYQVINGEKCYLINKVKIEDEVHIDECINKDTLTELEKRKAFVYAFELVKSRFLKATKYIHPIKIEEINTFEMLDVLSKWVNQNKLTLLPYFTQFKKDVKTGRFYNLELYEVYSLIVSIGYSTKLMQNKYGSIWQQSVDRIKSIHTYLKNLKQLDEITESLYQFSISYKPKDKNKYIIKLLLQMGLSKSAIVKLQLPIKGDNKTSKESYDSVQFPIFPIKLKP